MRPLRDIFEFHHIFHHPIIHHSRWPQTFEALGQRSGFVLYQTTIKDHFTDPALLEIKGLHDRGYIYIDENFRGILSRMSGIHSMPISAIPGEKLQIIIENQGRICFGPKINDFKGIVSNVTINGKPMENWKMVSFPMDLNALNELSKMPFETR